MNLLGMLSTAESGTYGFDCNQVLTAAQARSFYNDPAKFRFVMRYVSRNIIPGSNDLTRNECEDIHKGGLGIGIVQHVSAEGWDASGTKGNDYGTHAVSQVRDMGFPPGMTVWCDLEGVMPNDSDSDVIAFCSEWYNAVDKANYNPGLYCGWRTLLNGSQLGNLPFKSYWSAYNLNKDEFPPRGFQIRQDSERIKYGVRYDPDTAQADKHGDYAWFYWPLPV